MKIAVDIREALREKAGKGYYTIHLVSELLELDKKNHYILYSDQPIETLDELPNASRKIINKKGMKWHKEVLKDLYKEKADIFFAPTSYIIPALHDPDKIKVVMTVHDLVSFLFPLKHNKKAVITERLFLKKAIKKAAHIIPVSGNTKKDLLKRFECDPEKLTVVTNAASDIFEPNNEDALKIFILEKKIPANFIFTAGTLEPRKNFNVLIRAFNKVLKKFPDYKLLIAGKKGWYFENIFKTVRELDLEEKVEFLGYVPERELVMLYNLAKVFVYPSIYEGFGIPPLEAMKSGCPVITSNTSSLPEVVDDAALLVNPNSEGKIAESIIKVLSSKKLRDELREKGFIQAQKFSWENSAKKLLEIFESL